MMFVIIRTAGGKKYARRIGEELKRINRHNYWICPSVNYFPESFRNRPRLNPNNTIIHSRAAYPDGPTWMRNLVNKENEGYRVINNTSVLRLTSNKLACSMKMLREGFPHPRTWHYIGGSSIDSIHREIVESGVRKVVAKPYTSMNQGASVERIEITESQQTQCTCAMCGNQHTRYIPGNPEELRDAINRQPTGSVVIQEYVDYISIHRVIVIGGRALPVSWMDAPTPTRWKVSVCLNRNMRFNSRPDQELLDLAERTQEAIEGEINFIDVVKTREGYVLSAINTACNLLIHERKAREAGSTYWNIAERIANYLNRQARFS